MLLRRGYSGDQVEELQQRLKDADHDPGGADGVFGPKTERAVRGFQERHGLVADGIVGTATWSALISRGAFVVRPAVRWFGARRVELWHAALDRSKVRPAYRFSVDPTAMTARHAAGSLPAWPRKRLTEIARGAPLAINGGFFDTRSGWPIGTTIHGGRLINDLPDYNGNRLAVVELNPNLEIWTNPEPGKTCAPALLERGVSSAFMTITHLLRGGRPDIGACEPWLRTPQPRACLGWNDHYIHVVVADGRSLRSRGITIQEAAQLLLDAGCTEAVDMDSGGSAEMVLGGEVVNRPSDGRERPMPGGLCFELI